MPHTSPLHSLCKPSQHSARRFLWGSSHKMNYRCLQCKCPPSKCRSSTRLTTSTFREHKQCNSRLPKPSKSLTRKGRIPSPKTKTAPRRKENTQLTQSPVRHFLRRILCTSLLSREICFPQCKGNKSWIGLVNNNPISSLHRRSTRRQRSDQRCSSSSSTPSRQNTDLRRKNCS